MIDLISTSKENRVERSKPHSRFPFIQPPFLRLVQVVQFDKTSDAYCTNE